MSTARRAVAALATAAALTAAAPPADAATGALYRTTQYSGPHTITSDHGSTWRRTHQHGVTVFGGQLRVRWVLTASAAVDRTGLSRLRATCSLLVEFRNTSGELIDNRYLPSVTLPDPELKHYPAGSYPQRTRSGSFLTYDRLPLGTHVVEHLTTHVYPARTYVPSPIVPTGDDPTHFRIKGLPADDNCAYRLAVGYP